MYTLISDQEFIGMPINIQIGMEQTHRTNYEHTSLQTAEQEHYISITIYFYCYMAQSHLYSFPVLERLLNLKK